jgi:hypothetical protein
MKLWRLPQNRRFYFEIEEFLPPFALPTKEDNICESIWDKSEVLLRTLWGTCEKLGNSLVWKETMVAKFADLIWFWRELDCTSYY